MRDLAIRLLSEAGSLGEERPAAAHVLERMDAVLWRVAGQVGSRTLMQRALAMARAEAPTLTGLRIPPDGPLAGAGWPLTTTTCSEPQHDQVVLVAQVLELLRIFIGERLTLQLVKEAWPELDQNSDVVPLDPTS
jgi:hypothetical protein